MQRTKVFAPLSPSSATPLLFFSILTFFGRIKKKIIIKLELEPRYGVTYGPPAQHGHVWRGISVYLECPVMFGGLKKLVRLVATLTTKRMVLPKLSVDQGGAGRSESPSSSEVRPCASAVCTATLRQDAHTVLVLSPLA